MKAEITLHFYGELNDFLPQRQKNKPVLIPDFGKRSLKDIIQSAGFPIIEVGEVLQQDESVSLLHHVQSGDQFHVYPGKNHVDKNHALEPAPRFILDVHLGKLSKYLRMFGFDTLYNNSYNDDDLELHAAIDDRIMLTRDIGLLKRKSIRNGYWMRNTAPQKQVIEVLQRFKLQRRLRPMSVCMKCNGPIVPVDKQRVVHLLLPDTAKHFTKFYQCRDCRQIYWKGSHYKRMMTLVQPLINNLHV